VLARVAGGEDQDRDARRALQQAGLLLLGHAEPDRAGLTVAPAGG
ncbi:hypothetical protein ABH931_006053, partial [Streptacidiphilus sp. MAP12-33]